MSWLCVLALMHCRRCLGNIPLNHINKALWTADELQAVVGDLSLRGLVKHAHLLLFLYEMGCRHSEAYRLTAKDIDLRQGTVHFFKEKPDHKNQNRQAAAHAPGARRDQRLRRQRQARWCLAFCRQPQKQPEHFRAAGAAFTCNACRRSQDPADSHAARHLPVTPWPGWLHGASRSCSGLATRI